MMVLDEARARALARENPSELINILRDRNRTPVELYFAAEFAAHAEGFQPTASGRRGGLSLGYGARRSSDRIPPSDR